MLDIKSYEEELILKLLNSLKGSALSIVSANDMMMTDEERRQALDAVAKIKEYIEAYPVQTINNRDTTEDVIR